VLIGEQDDALVPAECKRPRRLHETLHTLAANTSMHPDMKGAPEAR
jgi:hypothetical protein